MRAEHSDFKFCNILYKTQKDGSYKVDVDAMASLCDSNTAVLVGSAAGFPHGVIDDIPAIAKLGSSVFLWALVLLLLLLLSPPPSKDALRCSKQSTKGQRTFRCMSTIAWEVSSFHF